MDILISHLLTEKTTSEAHDEKMENRAKSFAKYKILVQWYQPLEWNQI